MNASGEVFQHLFVRVAEEGRHAGVHRPVLEVVQIREDGNLGKLADARNEREALLRFERLDYGIERLELVAELRDVRLHQMSEKRLVVFIDEKHHASVGRLRGQCVDKPFEKNRRRRARNARDAKFASAVRKMLGEEFAEFVHIARLHGAHVEMQDRPLLRPVPFRLDGEAPEKIAPPLEKRLQRRNGERLPEAARTGDEKLRAPLSGRHFMQNARLVNVCEAFFPKPRKRVDVCRDFFHLPKLYHKSPRLWREI